MDVHSRVHLCKSNPGARYENARIAGEMAKAFANHPGVIGWQIDNEIWSYDYGCYCDRCKAGFKKYLKEKFGTIEALNAYYGAAEDSFDTPLNDIIRPILTFGEEDSVADIWEKLLEKKEHISAILDEYGSLRGIVTMEDVIETMLGQEIVDEKDEVVDMQEYAKDLWEEAQKDIIIKAED